MIADPVVGRAILAFFASELALALVRRARFTRGATSADRGTRLVLVVVITGSITLAVMVSRVPATAFPWPAHSVNAAALTLVGLGLAIRWWAVFTLGRFFTVDVAIHEGHALVDRGPYRLVRHPSYTGLLLVFAGMGIALGNALSCAVLLVPIAVALRHRMRVEEAALHGALGAPYEAYCATTKRLIPGVY